MIIYNGTYCVYAHINQVNGKMYVGVTKYGNNPNKRWKNGCAYLDKDEKGEYRQPHFAYAIQKYGWDNFDHEIIALKLTKEEADKFEELLVEKLNLTDSKFGYNIRNGGGSTGDLSDETKKKISESRKGISFSKEHRRALSDALKSIKQSEETVKKRVAKLSGKKRSEEVKAKLSESIKKSFTPERREKISESNRIRWSDPNARLRQGEIARQKKSQPVFCIELNKTFPSAKEAERLTGISDSNIGYCCSGKRASAGKHPITGEKLHWISEKSDPVLLDEYRIIFEMYKKEANIIC